MCSPFCSTSISIVERQIRHAAEGTRTPLVQSGHPRTWWPLASRLSCQMTNIQDIDGESAWSRVFGIRVVQQCMCAAQPVLKELPKLVPTATPCIVVGVTPCARRPTQGECLIGAVSDLERHLSDDHHPKPSVHRGPYSKTQSHSLQLRSR